ncbi:unnamed protein product [Malus baccata var. baccata]
MEHAEHALDLAIRRGIMRVWIWDGEARAPPELIDGMVEYARIVAERSFGHMKSYGTVTGTKQPECDKFWWKGKDPEVVGQFHPTAERGCEGQVARSDGG